MELYLNKNATYHVPLETSTTNEQLLSTWRIPLKGPASLRAINPTCGERHWPQELIDKLESTSSKYQEEKKGERRYHLCVHITKVQENSKAPTTEVKMQVHGFLCDMLQELDSQNFKLRIYMAGQTNHLYSTDIPVSSRVALGPGAAADNVCLRGEKYFECTLSDSSSSWSPFYHYLTHIKGSMNVILSQDKPDGTEMMRICRKILEEQIHTDMTIVAYNGKEVGCNKGFLAAHSTVFAAMLDKPMEEAVTGPRKIEMVNMDEEDVHGFLAYLYYMDVTAPNTNSRIALKLLQAAHQYDIPQLEREMKEILSLKPTSWCDVEVAVELFLYARQLNNENHREFKIRTLGILKSMADNMSVETLKRLVRGNAELAAQVMFEMLQEVISSDACATSTGILLD